MTHIGVRVEAGLPELGDPLLHNLQLGAGGYVILIKLYRIKFNQVYRMTPLVGNNLLLTQFRHLARAVGQKAVRAAAHQLSELPKHVST